MTTTYRPGKHHAEKMRVHDYLYDSAFIVSGARDYARMAFRSAMASAQAVIQPLYKTMFSELRRYPQAQVVYHMNCRLPDHMDCSYQAYEDRVRTSGDAILPDLAGKDRFKYSSNVKAVLHLTTTIPEFHPPTPVPSTEVPTRPRNRGTQSLFRESSAQTIPWQPDGKPAESCLNTPEVLCLDKLEWGPGKPYRTGDLPADFHTTEIINKMRHARHWQDLIEKGRYPRWMKKPNEVIVDVETKDWIFREAEIDELQEIRLELLHRLQRQQRAKQHSRSSKKLTKLWEQKKQEMTKKLDHIRHTRDREIRKLTALHGGGGRVGQVARIRAARGHGPMTLAAKDPTSDIYAPLARHGYQARRRHAEIVYDPALLSLEDHRQCAEPPAWLESCGHDLHKSCSGHHLPRDNTQLCERETKWSEEFLEQLHNDLKKARLGAASTTNAGPLHVLKPRKKPTKIRPPTPEVGAVDDEEETNHQAALLLQRIIRGRAVQNLMYEGRTRAGELTEELKTTHGLQREDRVRIAREEDRARDYNAVRSEGEQREDAISALVDELCGGAVSAALDFLEKELRRLKEERRQHAFILIALREKTMREAAEAGRRQKEIHRLKEHDEIFKHVLGVTQETVEEYIRETIQGGVELAAEEHAIRMMSRHADRIDAEYNTSGAMSTAEEHESVAELVQQFLLPEVHKQASKLRVTAMQEARAKAARDAIFGIVDEAEIVDDEDTKQCIRCGVPLGDRCRCLTCPVEQMPTETVARDDSRWIHTRAVPRPPEKTASERFPPHAEIRCMLNVLVDEAVQIAKEQCKEREEIMMVVKEIVDERVLVGVDTSQMVDYILDRATGVISPPVRDADFRFVMRRHIEDALARSEPYPQRPCPFELPSEVRRRVAAEAVLGLPPSTACECEDSQPQMQIAVDPVVDEHPLLPSELRDLEEMRKCKCDTDVPSATMTQDDRDDSETGDTGFTDLASTTDVTETTE